MDNISLIIPFYNGSEYIKDAILSAINQTVSFYEIIVVNDGSNDKESHFVKELADIYKLIYITKQNGGQGSARNAGARISKSQYLCFLDQDDILLPEHNKTLIEGIKTQSKYMQGLVYANYCRAEADQLIYSRMSRPKKLLIDLNDRSIYSFVSQDIHILPSAMIISRSAFFDIGGFDEKFRGYEDDDLSLRIFIGGYHITYVDKEVCVWRMHKKQTINSEVMMSSRLNYINKWCDYLYDNTVDVRRIRILLYKRFRSAIYHDLAKASSQSEYILANSIAKIFHCKFSDLHGIDYNIKYYLSKNNSTKKWKKSWIV